MTSAEQTEAIRKTMEAEKQASRDELVIALKAVAQFPITEPNNMDAVNMKIIAISALRKAGAL